jgi:hypothetical protein
VRLISAATMKIIKTKIKNDKSYLLSLS